MNDAVPECKGFLLLADVRWMFQRAVPGES